MNMHSKDLINEELVETVYLYTHKRLNNKADAEDLSQDILTAALYAIHRGAQVKDFYPWFWGLAHKRYCTFLAHRKQRNAMVTLDEGLSPTAAADAAPLDDILIRDEISELNYAISRLSAAHREMVIMFYLNEMPIAHIAKTLQLPEGTIKRRLFDTRGNLKKALTTINLIGATAPTLKKRGLHFMKNTGKSSYAPAKIYTWGTGNAPSADRIIHQGGLILKQILVVCRNQAKTLNEIADEIGVAPVYLEDIMAPALDFGLLKTMPQDKILTDICILPSQPVHDANHEIGKIYEALGSEIHAAILQKKADILALNFYGSKEIVFDDLLWHFYRYAVGKFSSLCTEIIAKKWEGKVSENNGKNYRLSATYEYPGDKLIERGELKSTAVSHLGEEFKSDGFGSKHGRVSYDNNFRAEPFPWNERDGWVNAGNATLLHNLIEAAKNGETYALKPGIEEEHAAVFISRGIIKKEGARLIVNIPVINWEMQRQIGECLANELRPLAEKYAAAVASTTDRHILPYIRQDLLEEYAHWIQAGYFWPLDYVMFWAMYDGKTVMIPDDPHHSAIGLCIVPI